MTAKSIKRRSSAFRESRFQHKAVKSCKTHDYMPAKATLSRISHIGQQLKMQLKPHRSCQCFWAAVCFCRKKLSEILTTFDYNGDSMSSRFSENLVWWYSDSLCQRCAVPLFGFNIWCPLLHSACPWDCRRQQRKKFDKQLCCACFSFSDFRINSSKCAIANSIPRVPLASASVPGVWPIGGLLRKAPPNGAVASPWCGHLAIWAGWSEDR